MGYHLYFVYLKYFIRESLPMVKEHARGNSLKRKCKLLIIMLKLTKNQNRAKTAVQCSLFLPSQGKVRNDRPQRDWGRAGHCTWDRRTPLRDWPNCSVGQLTDVIENLKLFRLSRRSFTSGLLSAGMTRDVDNDLYTKILTTALFIVLISEKITTYIRVSNPT